MLEDQEILLDLRSHSHIPDYLQLINDSRTTKETLQLAILGRGQEMRPPSYVRKNIQEKERMLQSPNRWKTTKDIRI